MTSDYGRLKATPFYCIREKYDSSHDASHLKKLANAEVVPSRGWVQMTRRCLHRSRELRKEAGRQAVCAAPRAGVAAVGPEVAKGRQRGAARTPVATLDVVSFRNLATNTVLVCTIPLLYSGIVSWLSVPHFLTQKTVNTHDPRGQARHSDEQRCSVTPQQHGGCHRDRPTTPGDVVLCLTVLCLYVAAAAQPLVLHST